MTTTSFDMAPSRTFTIIPGKRSVEWEQQFRTDTSAQAAVGAATAPDSINAGDEQLAGPEVHARRGIGAMALLEQAQARVPSSPNSSRQAR